LIHQKTNNQAINQINKKIHLEMMSKSIQKKENYFLIKMNKIAINNKNNIQKKTKTKKI
jgi:hypothetical protein